MNIPDLENQVTYIELLKKFPDIAALLEDIAQELKTEKELEIEKFNMRGLLAMEKLKEKIDNIKEKEKEKKINNKKYLIHSYSTKKEDEEQPNIINTLLACAKSNLLVTENLNNNVFKLLLINNTGKDNENELNGQAHSLCSKNLEIIDKALRSIEKLREYLR